MPLCVRIVCAVVGTLYDAPVGLGMAEK